ncbi:hypothetical protein AGLY_004778 [Aphis glycines]|uniref:Uncharacterized protein n=1 Tax=Aphis glycines TaxID=307491 RepID=A0A6G0TW49_APHGL|nr:hypothetical protein AGLY_004778 [Aphis glycines]
MGFISYDSDLFDELISKYFDPQNYMQKPVTHFKIITLDIKHKTNLLAYLIATKTMTITHANFFTAFSNQVAFETQDKCFPSTNGMTCTLTFLLKPNGYLGLWRSKNVSTHPSKPRQGGHCCEKRNEFSQATYIILYLDSLHNRNLAIRPSKLQQHGLHCVTRFSIRLPEMSMVTCHEKRDLQNSPPAIVGVLNGAVRSWLRRAISL